MKLRVLAAVFSVTLLAMLPAYADNPHCQNVGGVLMTNVGVITPENEANVKLGVNLNLGPVFGDLAGSVAAQILNGGKPNADGTFTVQHYWVTSQGDTINFARAILKPTYPGPAGVVAVPWGNYSSAITGGTGRFANATGNLDYFGIADFIQNTLVLRYRGSVCFK